MILDDKLAAGDTVVLDGAIGTEISRLGVEMSSSIWCGVANKTHADVVRRVHESYLRLGVDVITANTFSSSRHCLDAVGLAAETVAINRGAVELAREARDELAPSRPVAIAGSISHMKATEPEGWWPDSRYDPTPAQEAANYRELADTLAEAGCDLLLMEMMMFRESSLMAIEAALATGLPTWVGFSCARDDDGTLINHVMGKRPADADPGFPPETVSLAEHIDALLALGPHAAGIMHAAADLTSPGLKVLFERWPGPVMAYPETAYFQHLGEHPTITMEPAEFGAHCRGWVEDGVQIIGGCCGTSVDHIRAMMDVLPNRPGTRPQATLAE